MQARPAQSAGHHDRIALGTWPYFEADELEAAQRVLSSGKINYWTGLEGKKFEAEFAQATGVRHAVALANGTVALEAAFLAAGLEPGDDLIVTPRTFIASISAAVLHGIRPIFADVDRDSGNITAETIEAALTPRTRGIVAVHLGGWPCEMDAINALARERGIRVVEDCAQSHGAAYRGKSVGSLADVAAWSFCQDKIMTTAGEGGMLTTDDPGIWRTVWSMKDHGKGTEALEGGAPNTTFRWLHHSFGTNWRLTEIQSAIGRLQLKKLPEWIRIRRRNASILTQALEGIDCVRVPEPPPHIHHSYYKYYAFVKPGQLAEGWDRDRILREISSTGVPCMMGSCSEVYRERAFTESGLQPAAPLPVARELGETSLMFQVHPTLTEEQMQHVANTAAGVLKHACRTAVH